MQAGPSGPIMTAWKGRPTILSPADHELRHRNSARPKAGDEEKFCAFWKLFPNQTGRTTVWFYNVPKNFPKTSSPLGGLCTEMVEQPNSLHRRIALLRCSDSFGTRPSLVRGARWDAVTDLPRFAPSSVSVALSLPHSCLLSLAARFGRTLGSLLAQLLGMFRLA